VNALILVDLQNDFVEGGALAVPCGLEIIPLANRMQEKFNLIVATQDWHPADHGSFAASHPGKQPGEQIDLDGLPQTLWPVHCVQGSPGADFVPGLDRSRWSAIFQKGIDPRIDSYSGIFDNARRRQTGLADFLRGHGVTAVTILGLATDYCVKFTALDAAALGFDTTVIIDACRGVNLSPGDTQSAIDDMKRAGVHIARSDDLLRVNGDS